MEPESAGERLRPPVPRVRVRLTLLGAGEGGRSTPVLDTPTYRPHLVVGSTEIRRVPTNANGRSTEHYLGVHFCGDGATLELGGEYVVELALWFHPNVDYGALVESATFTVREGGHVVGFGEVLERWNDGDDG